MDVGEPSAAGPDSTGGHGAPSLRLAPGQPDVARGQPTPDIPLSDVASRLNAALEGRYRIKGEVGVGGMATVYLAEDIKHRRDVALKVLQPELSDSLGPERFLREIRTAARLTHPHILPLHDSGEAAGLLYYVMPYVEGESLAGRLRREKQLPLHEVVEIASEVAEALTYAHSQDVVHRDVKPGNILFSTGGVLLADFGIAKALTSAGADALTQTGIAIGTPTYMSPEQAFPDGALTGRSDAYSLACVVYEMLVGQPPFGGSSSQVVMARHAVDQPHPIKTVRHAVPEQVDEVVAKAMAKSPADRFATPSDFARALAAAATADPGETKKTTSVLGGLSRKARLSLVAATIAVVGLLAWPALRPPSGVVSAVPTLVVMPFENLGEAEDEYIAAGITDEITSRLSHLTGLSVISRMSAIAYAGPNMSIDRIASELGAEYLLSGTVRTDRRPDRTGVIRVVPHLVRLPAADEIWTSTLDASIVPGEIIETQAQIAEGVATAMDVRLLPPELLALREGRTSNQEAYDHYLRGTALAARPFVEETARQAIELYERAAALDEDFVHAFARLSEANSQYHFFFDRSIERRNRAQAALERAFAIDSANSATRLALGYYRNWALMDYDGALAEFESVRLQQPSNSKLLYVMGAALRRAGRWDEAVDMYSRAFELNPREQAYALDLGSTYLILRRYPESERFLDHVISLTPDWAPPYVLQAHLYLSWQGSLDRARAALLEGAARAGWDELLSMMIPFRYLLAAVGGEVQDSLARLTLDRTQVDSARYYLANADWHAARGRPAAAREYFDSARVVGEGRVAARPDEPTFRVDLGLAYAGLGRAEEAIDEGLEATRLVPFERDAYFGALHMYGLLEIYMHVGEYDAALDVIDVLLARPSTRTVAMLLADPHYAPLRELPRFQQLLR